MEVSPIIQRLRTKLTSFGNRIHGAAEFDLVEDKSRLQVPALYIGYDGSTATSNPKGANVIDQDLDERLKILLLINNTSDRTGKIAQDQVHGIRTALWAALLGYQIEPYGNFLEYVGDSMYAQNAARYLHKFEFRLASVLSTEDATPLDYLDEFNKIYADYELTETTPSEHPDAQDRIELEN